MPLYNSTVGQVLTMVVNFLREALLRNLDTLENDYSKEKMRRIYSCKSDKFIVNN